METLAGENDIVTFEVLPRLRAAKTALEMALTGAIDISASIVIANDLLGIADHWQRMGRAPAYRRA